MITSIVMTTWKRQPMTERALYTIKMNTSLPHKMIVIDNGSDYQGWLTMAKKEGFIDTLILLDKNYGLEAAKHLAMGFVESERFVSTDNDILASPGWLSKLNDLMDKYPYYGAIACRPQVLVGTGNIFEGVETPILEFNHVPGYLRLMDTKLVKDLGAWEDKTPLRGHEEYWISERIKDAGKKVGWAVNVPCYHMFGDERDTWGYGDMNPEEHGHNMVGGLPVDDWNKIREVTEMDLK